MTSEAYIAPCDNLFDGIAPLPELTKPQAAKVLKDYMTELRTAFDDDEYVATFHNLQTAISMAIGALEGERIDVYPGFDSVRCV